MAGKIKGGYLRLAKTQTSAARRLITMPSATPARQLQFNCGPSKAVAHVGPAKPLRIAPPASGQSLSTPQR
jgi:hypothetical protein